MLFSLPEGRERRKALKCALQYSIPAYEIVEERENLVLLFIKPLSCLIQLNPIISKL